MRDFHKMNRATLFFTNFVCVAFAYTIFLYFFTPKSALRLIKASGIDPLISIVVFSFFTSLLGSVMMYLWGWIKSRQNLHDQFK